MSVSVTERPARSLRMPRRSKPLPMFQHQARAHHGAPFCLHPESVPLPVAVGFGQIGAGCALTLVGEPDLTTAPVRAAARPTLRLLPEVDERPGPGPVLTARGRCVAAVGAASVGLVLIVASWFGAEGASTPPGQPVPARVVVHDGDTLWSIAREVAPGRDTRDEVSDLRRINGLINTLLSPGQSLRTR